MLNGRIDMLDSAFRLKWDQSFNASLPLVLLINRYYVKFQFHTIGYWKKIKRLTFWTDPATSR